MREVEEVTSLNGKITDFMDKDRATPENVNAVAEEVIKNPFLQHKIQFYAVIEKTNNVPHDLGNATQFPFYFFQCLAAELRLNDITISNIATEINNAIENVADVEGILGDTREDLLRVQTLADASKQAESYAKDELTKANKVTDDLSKALEAQNTADVSIQATQTKIGSAREDLAQVNSQLGIQLIQWINA